MSLFSMAMRDDGIEYSPSFYFRKRLICQETSFSQCSKYSSSGICSKIGDFDPLFEDGDNWKLIAHIWTNLQGISIYGYN